MEQLQELPQILLTVFICVRQIDKTKSSYEDLQTLFDSPLLEVRVEEEFFEDPDSWQAEVSIA